MRSITPECTHSGLGSFHFARRYFGNRVFFLFLRLLRCFTSPGALYPPYLIQVGVTGHYSSRVPPFGNLRINAYLRLPSAYRSLSRPSSAISAMASTLRSCSLDLASSRQSSLPKTIENDDQQRLFVVLFLPCAVFKVRCVFKDRRHGGLKWTRTTDLTLIRRVL